MAWRVNGRGASHLKTFTAFYDIYAPKLWGIILQAKLPTPQAEQILLNTLTKAWQQIDRPTLSDKHLICQLLTLAYGEGLPTDLLKAILEPKD